MKKLLMKNICPKEEDFADYVEGRLTDARRDELETHFLNCENCTYELMAISSVIYSADQYAEDAVPERVTLESMNVAKENVVSLLDLFKAGFRIKPGITETARFKSSSIIHKIKQILQQIYSFALARFNIISGSGPHPVIIRNSGKIETTDQIQLKKTFKEIEFEIIIEKLIERKVNIHIKKINIKEVERSIRATLIKDENEITSYLISDHNEIIFEFVPYGNYSIIFSENGRIFGKWPFFIKE